MSRATIAARFAPRIVLATLVLGAMLVHVSAAHASPTPEQRCQQGRYTAAAKYAACEQKAWGRFFGGSSDFNRFQVVASKCRVKYSATWDKLVASGTGSTTCVGARFRDNGDGTVTDNLTALQWEKKTNLDSATNFADRHDADNYYSWSASGTAADGTAFTDFLANLNGGGCFAAQCDWRLPTIQELQTLLAEPCSTSPCISAALGPTVAFVGGFYWSSTTPDANPNAWFLFFIAGPDPARLGGYPKTTNNHVRAVRGGL